MTISDTHQEEIAPTPDFHKLLVEVGVL